MGSLLHQSFENIAQAVVSRGYVRGIALLFFSAFIGDIPFISLLMQHEKFSGISKYPPGMLASFLLIKVSNFQKQFVRFNNL